MRLLELCTWVTVGGINELLSMLSIKQLTFSGGSRISKSGRKPKSVINLLLAKFS